MLNDFYDMLNKYQSDVIDFLMKNPNRLIIIRGTKFTGKTTMIYKIFEQESQTPVIYHTGCDPTKRQIAYKYFEKTLNKYSDQNCLVVLDEFYTPDVCEYFRQHPKFKVLLFVNSHELNYTDYKTFNLFDVYEQYKKEFFKDSNINWQDKNIRELKYTMEHSDIKQSEFEATQNNFEKLRSSSNITQTKVKYLNSITTESITFARPIKVYVDIVDLAH